MDFANDTIHERLRRHEAFVMERRKADKPLKHVNSHYGFPVIMNQEKNLKFNPLTRVDNPEAGVWTVDYSETVDWQSTIENAVSIEPAAAPAPGRKIRKRQHKNAPADQVPANSQSDNKTDNPPDEQSDAERKISATGIETVNVVFFVIVLVAFGFAGWQQITWVPVEGRLPPLRPCPRPWWNRPAGPWNWPSAWWG
ncbi:MAG: hypothetical protein R2861_11835 [Desulfobacterales bacterium]